MRKAIDLTGEVFARLTVLERAENNSRGNIMWLCKCACGNATRASSVNLKSTGTRSCGCIKREMLQAKATHGMSYHPLYKTWCGIIKRTTNPNASNYPAYGGRGITICERWKNSFENFVADMGEKPSRELSIERINNDGNYEPSNCIWASRGEQSRNTSRSRLITFNGKTMCLTDWAELIGINPRTLSERLAKWTKERALNTPSNRRKAPTATTTSPSLPRALDNLLSSRRAA